MQLGLGERHGYPQHPTTAGVINAQRNECRAVNDLPAGAHLLVARIKHHVLGRTQCPITPRLKAAIELPCSAANLGGA